MFGSGRDLELALGLGGDPVLLHQPGDPVPAADKALGFQFKVSPIHWTEMG